MKQSIRLGTISGIPIGLNWGLLLIAGFYTVLLSTRLLPAEIPGSSPVMYWLGGVVGVILLFFSVLAHELGHSIVARRNGIAVESVTLWIMGGVAKLKGEAQTPGAEFRIAAAGPAVNVVLTAIFVGGWVALEALNGPSITATTLLWLAVINGALAAFNLIPASPLDGGRILAAILWKLRNDKQSGRRTAALSGNFFGSLLIAFGVLSIFGGGGGLWFVVLGVFLRGASGQELRRSELFAAAEGRTTGEIMVPLERSVHGAVTFAGLAGMMGDMIEDRATAPAFPVRGENGNTLGLVPGSMITPALRRQADTRLDVLAIGWEDFVTAWDHEPVTDLLDRYTEAGCTHALVYNEAGEQVGYIGAEHIVAAKHRPLAPAAPADDSVGV